MQYLAKVLFFVYIFCYSNFIKAQVCSGVFGQPLINQTFGQGDNVNNWYGPLSRYAPGASTSTTFINHEENPRNLVSNQSGLVKTPATPGNPFPIYWQPHADHTGDENGLMFLIDGIQTPTVFFEQTMDNLCPNTTLRLSIWVLNANSPTIVSQNPNMILRIIDLNGNILGNGETGNVPADRLWHQYAIDFNNGNSSTITLQLINNTATNAGNDFALDDITVQACGPSINLFSPGNEPILNMCEGNTNNFTLDANISSAYSNPVYQWQENTGNTWMNIDGKTTKQVSLDFLNRVAGSYKYRLITATDGNINSVNCRAISNPVTVTVFPQTIAKAENSGPTCIGNTVQLNASGGTIYKWAGPNGYTSTEQNPRINNADINMSGTYTVEVKNEGGCTSSSSTVVEVIRPISASVVADATDLCEGESTQIFATGGTSYHWSPAIGLSNANIANPIATPKVSTNYMVTVSNGDCTAQAIITIHVKKAAEANAGDDKKILGGSNTILSGKVTGDNVNYHWFPADYLDDPTKLNPTASPPADITYKLIAQTDCNISEDEVKVTVFQKVIIPNTFSPNGDSINDTWHIPIMEVFPRSTLQIFDRTGILVYQGNSISQPWDGKLKGKDLPIASYFYKLFLDADQKVYSGWVLLIR